MPLGNTGPPGAKNVMKAPGRTLRPWEEGWKESIFGKLGHSKASTYIDVFRMPGHAHNKDKLGKVQEKNPKLFLLPVPKLCLVGFLLPISSILHSYFSSLAFFLTSFCISTL